MYNNRNATIIPQRVLAVAALLFTLPLLAFGAEATTDYYGIYLQNNKIGYMSVHKDTSATYSGKPAVRTDTETSITLNVLGATSKSLSTSISYNDPKTGVPLAQESRSEAAGRVSLVKTTYGSRSVTYTADIQGTKRTGTLTLQPGEIFLTDPSNGSADFIPTIGLSMKGKTFVPDLLKLINDEIVVVRKETVAVGSAAAVEAFVVEDRSEMATATLYVTAKGDLLKILLTLGMEMRKEPKDIALAAPNADTQKDLALVVGITPTGASLDDPRKATKVRYLVSGAAHDLPPSDDRQATTYAGTGATRTATLAITAKSLPEAASVTRFAKPEDAPEALRPYLKPSDYVSSDDPIFTTLAKDATGGETDIAKAAAKIATFVHSAVTPDPAIAALRTANDINKERRGVCRDYTTFYTAIARAAGIPTRQCTGVAYVNGQFLYHAWPEVWAGDATGWVALEPTWGRPYADATHIKLAQGEITDMYRIADDMGKYKIEVLEAK